MLLGLLGLLLAAAGHATPALRVELPSGEPRVGDPVALTLVLTAPTAELAGEPRFPAWQKTWGDAEIVAVGPIERTLAGDTASFRQTVTLAAFATGAVPLPPQFVAVPGPSGTTSVSTGADLQLQVRSVLPAGEEKIEPKPPAPPRPLPVGPPFWWSLGIGLLLCAAVWVTLWRRQRRRAEAGAVAAPTLDPLPELLAALAALAAVGEATIEPAHTRLSLALRRYLGRRLGFAAVESTTSEIARELRGRRAPASALAQTIRLLRDCDGVKFARERAALPTLAARLSSAEAAAREIETHFRPEPPALPALEPGAAR
jgi:hypothetical protein